MGAISFNNKLYPTGGTNQASDSVYDNSSTGLPTTTQGAIDKTTDNIASANSVELTATAAHAHAVGTYFIWIGQFVKVTSAIEVGDTIVDGTNVEATSIADVLAAANGAIDGKQDKLTNPLTQSDVINSLASDAVNVPLSAAQGKALNDSKLRISRQANSAYSEIMGRTSDEIISLNIYDVNRSGLSVDFNYAASTICIFKVVNGAAVGHKSVHLQ